ncbi:MAG: hemerythrin domain-containing protein, partial [Sphingomonas sp.]
MDITQLILDEHAQQRALFAQIDSIDAKDTEALSALWTRLKNLLDAHAEAEERFFYPRLMKIGT